MTDGESKAARREELNRRLAVLLRAAFVRRTPPPPPGASIELRLAHLESELAEVRSRVNGLFFAILGSLALEVVGQVAL